MKPDTAEAVPPAICSSAPCACRSAQRARQPFAKSSRACGSRPQRRRAQGALLQWLAVLLVAVLLTACGGSKNSRPASRGSGSSSPSRGYDDIRKGQSSRYRSRSDSVPTEAPDVSKLPEPVPKVEPRSLYGNKSPYSVLGQTYNVLPSPRGYVERGIASFYGNKFHGYKTSSLEDYDMYQFSAAHKTLPLPSYARVTNLENGKSVIVRINDRGPFHENRIIDLSFAAAVKLGVWPKGTGLVEVRAIDPSDPGSDRGAPYVKTTPKPAPVTAPLAVTGPPARAPSRVWAPSSPGAPSRVGASSLAGAPSAAGVPSSAGAPSAVGVPSPMGPASTVGAASAAIPRQRASSSQAIAAEAVPTSRLPPSPRTVAAPAAAMGAMAAAAMPEGHGEEYGDGRVSGMTDVSPAEALPPVAGSAAKTAGTAPVVAAVPAGNITPPVPGKPNIYLQVGAFSDAANAQRVADQLNRAGLGPVSVVEAQIGGRNVRRVRVGPLADVDAADRLTDEIAGMGLPRPQVAID